ncbi:MAG: glycosyltransferase family 4 protein [Pseudomonadota bacterium]
MRILQLCPYAMDRPGGVQRHVRDLAAWLRGAGHEVRVIAPPGHALAAPGNVQTLGRARRIALHGTAFELSYAAPWALRYACRDLRAWAPHVIHAHTPWTPLLVPQLLRRLDAPLVTTVHATLPDPAATGLADRYIRRAARRLLPRARALIIPSEAPLTMLRRTIPDIAAEIVPPAIDLSPWQPSSRPETALQILFAGRLEPRKGLADALAAWEHIAAAHPAAQMVVAGDGPEDGPERRRIAAAVSPRLRWVKAPDDAALRALMAQSDLMLAPAPYGESFGLILVEAMAAGCVPVAAANPGYASVLGPQSTALLAAPGDWRDLARKALKLVDPQQRHTLRDWGIAHAARFDITACGPRFLEIYHSATGV